MNKKLIFLFLFVLLASFSFALPDLEDKIIYKEKISKTYYDSDDNYALTKEIEAYYDNNYRHSTYDYRHGYSYRKTEDYWVDKHDFEVEDFRIVLTDDCRNCKRDRDEDYNKNYIIYSDIDRRRDYDKDHHGYRRYYHDDYDYYDYRDYDEPRVKRMYVPYLDDYEYRECYDHAPKGKLFYISCNDWLY